MKYLVWLIVPLVCTLIIPNGSVWYDILVIVLACGASILQVCYDDLKEENKQVHKSIDDYFTGMCSANSKVKDLEVELWSKNIELEITSKEKYNALNKLDEMHYKISSFYNFIKNPDYIAFIHWYNRKQIQETVGAYLNISRYQIKKRGEEINKLLGFDYIVWKNNGLSKKD